MELEDCVCVPTRLCFLPFVCTNAKRLELQQYYVYLIINIIFMNDNLVYTSHYLLFFQKLQKTSAVSSCIIDLA